MSRKMLITLIVLMVFVLTGLILVQTRMIKTASDIREEQFNQLVKNALLRVANQLNNYEVILARNSALNNQLQNSLLPNEKFNVFPNNSGQGTLSFGMQYSDNGVVREYKKEIQFNIGDSTKVKESNSFYGIESLVAFRKEQQLRRERFLND